jgi:SAM-dependent methyltransferase
MRPELYHQIFAGQTAHWWGRSRRKLSLDLLQRFGVGIGCAHADLGCGTGQNLGLLKTLKPSRIVGVDVSPIALELARNACPQAELIQASLNDQLPFDDATFDVVTIFNVLYHEWVQSDLHVFNEARRILKADGLLLVTEPAFESLARELDVSGMTKRRYRLRQFTELLRSADFDVMFSNYFTSFGAPLILTAKAVKRLKRKTAAAADVPDLRPMNPVINTFFYGLARIDAALVKASIPMPFGTTVLCVAKPRLPKPHSN